MSHEAAGEWKSIGTHLLRVEPPDLLFIRQRGPFLLEQCVLIFDEARKLAAAAGPILWLTDARELGEVAPDTRRFIGESGSDQFTRASAVFGLSFTQRAVAQFVSKAVALIRGGKPVPLKFFETEAEARAWLAEHRSEPPQPR